MLITLNFWAISGFSSTLSLATVRCSACSPAISPRIGAIILHGPHHSAQKSTTTGLSEDATVSSKVALVRVTMPSAMVGPFGWDNDVTEGATPGPGALFRARSVSDGLQPALAVDRGHAARTRCGDRLAVGVVLHIPTGEDAVDVRPRRAGPG